MTNSSHTAIRNKRFFEASKEFIVYALEILREDNDKEIEKIKSERPTDWMGAFKYDLQHYSESLFPIDFVLRNKGTLQRSPKFKECEKIMQEDHQISKHIEIDVVEIDPIINRVNVWEYFSHMVRKFAIPTIQFNEFQFAELYCDLEEFFYNDFVQVVYLAPLYGFDTNVDNIKLEEDLEIRNLRSEEKWLLPFMVRAI